MNRRLWVRWLPAMIAPVVVAGAALAWSLPASAAVTLPDKTPQQVLQLAASSTVSQFSGTVSQSSQLGLPSLPSGVGSSSSGDVGSSSSGDVASLSSALQLLSGSHTARVYVNGRTQVRVELTGSLSESDLVRNGNSVWTYDSKKNTAAHVLLPAGQTEHAPTAGSTPTPSSLAQQFLTSVSPTTQVTLGGNVRVAGRTAYDLVLTPRTTGTLVGSVSIAVDSQSGLPLSVEVLARGQSAPAVQVQFTSIKLQAPSAALFDFTPPAGAKVTTKTLTARPEAQPLTGSAGSGQATNGTAGQATIGSGWSKIVELPASALPSSFQATVSSPLVKDLTKQVSGGRVLSTSLVNVLMTNDGRVLIGSVPVSALQAAAGS
jgi:outer membrane lipoprotein-sorting protein